MMYGTPWFETKIFGFDVAMNPIFGVDVHALATVAVMRRAL